MLHLLSIKVWRQTERAGVKPDSKGPLPELERRKTRREIELRRATTSFGNSIIHVFPVSVHQTGITSSSRSPVHAILRDNVSGEYRTREPVKRTTLFRGMMTEWSALLLMHHSGVVICGFCATVQLRSTTESLQLDHHTRPE